MLLEDKEIKEIYDLKHRNDSANNYVDYQNKILTKSLSNLMFQNDTMYNFLLKTQKLLALFFDKFNIVKNWRNYTVDKYYYKGTD